MRWLVRLLTAAACLTFSLAAATPDPYPAPTVVVYPLTVTGGGDPGGELGSNIATLVANKLSDLGGLTVKPYIPGTPRGQYLDAAVKQGADYYVTGYITPVGGDVSMIVQIVSTYSGSIVYSTTAIARTFADAVGQADVVRSAILRHAGRGFAGIDAPGPVSSPSAAPLANDGNVDLTKALGRHRRRQSAAPAASASPAPTTPAVAIAAPVASATPAVRIAQVPRPSPAPRPSPVPKPSPVPLSSPSPRPSPTPPPVVAAAPRSGTAMVLEAEGSADPAARAYAAYSFSKALRTLGIGGGLLPVTVEQGIAHAAELCNANAGNALYAPTLAIVRGARGSVTVQLDVVAYDCKATPLGSRHVTIGVPDGRLGTAIDQATGKVADGLINGAR